VASGPPCGRDPLRMIRDARHRGTPEGDAALRVIRVRETVMYGDPAARATGRWSAPGPRRNQPAQLAGPAGLDLWLATAPMVGRRLDRAQSRSPAGPPAIATPVVDSRSVNSIAVERPEGCCWRRPRPPGYAREVIPRVQRPRVRCAALNRPLRPGKARPTPEFAINVARLLWLYDTATDGRAPDGGRLICVDKFGSAEPPTPARARRFLGGTGARPITATAGSRRGSPRPTSPPSRCSTAPAPDTLPEVLAFLRQLPTRFPTGHLYIVCDTGPRTTTSSWCSPPATPPG
jgi:hypothetical protein